LVQGMQSAPSKKRSCDALVGSPFGGHDAGVLVPGRADWRDGAS